MRFPFSKSYAQSFVALAAFSVIACCSAAAQTYPSRPIMVKVAFPAGGPADVAIRSANQIMQRYLGQNVLSENLPGAAGTISTISVLKAPADGYTLLGAAGTDLVVAPFTIASAKYKPEAFRFLGIAGMSDFVLVSNPAHSFGSIDELIDYAKKPGNKELTLAHWGPGSAAHLVGADFQLRSGTKFLEVPYKGAAPALTDITGQHIDLTFAPLGGPALELIQSGKVKAIAIASDKRNPVLPNVPTIGESERVKNFEYSAWSGFFAPPDTPDPVVERLVEAVNEWIKSPENLDRIAKNGSRPLEPMNVIQAATFFKNEQEKVTSIVRSLKLDPQ